MAVNPITSRLKTLLKMAINRLRLVELKETAVAKQQRRTMAQLLEVGKEQSARIRVENIIRQDINVELLEILELYCELLLARIGLLEGPECDPGLEEAVKTIIYAAPRTEIKELQQIRELLIHKFSKEFAHDAIENLSNTVPEKVMKRLSVEPPTEELVSLYLGEIARAYHVPFSELPEDEPAEIEDDEDDDDDGPPSGRIAIAEQPLTDEPSSPVAVSAPAPTTDNPRPTLKLSTGQTVKPIPPLAAPKSQQDKELDDLRKRFDALRKR